MKRAIKVVIFDLGGVVVKWSDDIAFRKAAKIAGVPFKKLKKAANNEITHIHKGMITETEFWRRVLRNSGAKKNLLKKVDKTWHKEYIKKSRLNSDVIKIAKRLHRKYRLGVISNLSKFHDIENRKRKYYKKLQHEILSYKVKLIKPDPRIYRLAARKVRCKPQECLFIDDKLVNVNGARKVGMKAIRFTSISKLKKDLKMYGVKV